MPGHRAVYVLDSDAAVCRSLETSLGSAGFEVLTFQSSRAFFNKIETLDKGCVLLDLRLPGPSGIEVLATLHRIRIDLPVIAMTSEGDVQIAVRAMKAGAVEFLEKPYGEEALLEAIRSALASGGTAVRLEEIADAMRRLDTLTPRESEVLERLIDGRSNKMIAYHLGLSVRTVEVHRARMMERLGVRQLAEALRLGIMARLGSRRSDI